MQAATEYVLVVVWCTATLFGALVVHGPRAHERFYITLIWALMQTRTFFIGGVVLFFVMWGLHRAGTPLFGVRVLGALFAPALAFVIGRHSFFFLLDQPGYYFLGPLIFLADFALCTLVYAFLLLPRHFKPDATPRLHVHWAVLAIFVPFVPSLLLHASNPQLRGPIFTVSTAKPHHRGEVIFARWTPGADALTVVPFDMHLPPPHGGLIPEPETPGKGYVNLTDEEAERLRAAGITGGVTVLGSSSLLDAGRLVVIMSQQIDAPFQFVTPAEGTKVVYIQSPGGWRKLPPEAGESKTRVRMYVPEGKSNVTGFELDTGTSPPWHDETRYIWNR